MVCVLAVIFLGEKAETREVMGILTCSVGTFLCLQFGPRPHQDRILEHISSGESQLRLHVYLAFSFSVLLVLLVLEHASYLGLNVNDGCHYFTLPVTTGLAFAVQKVFNTEIGLNMHGRSVGENLAMTFIWWMAAMVAVLGLTDFYLNLRGAKILPVQAFIPMAFAFGTGVQYFQSLVIFGEFSYMGTAHRTISVAGSAMALAGAVMIRPPRWSAVCGDEVSSDLLESDDDSSSSDGT